MYLRTLSKFRQNAKNINKVFDKYGGKAYTINEPITIKEHSKQSAELLLPNKTLAIAGYLHDYGHMIDEPIDPSSGIDDKHEFVAFKELSKMHFPKSVLYPIRDHVRAKRYKVYKYPEYKKTLTYGSLLSLKLQGGAMTSYEAKMFEKSPFFSESMLLRKADDDGKEEGYIYRLSESDYEDLIVEQMQIGFEEKRKNLFCLLN